MTELIAQMQAQIQSWDAVEDDRAIFLTCYAMMTENMLRTISDDGFEDGTWVRALTHRFAEYYFDALENYENNGSPPVWTFAFETACGKKAHVMQNLLLGVNAHICYDLIFAVADSIPTPWEELPAEQQALRYRDYCHVNEVIGSTLDAVQDQVVEKHDRNMNIIDTAFGRLDEWMIHALITRWRKQVWGQSVAYMQATSDARLTLKQTYIREAEQRSHAIQGQRGILGIVDIF
jgi:hypothetical protein